MTYSWSRCFDKVSLQLDQNCGFFIVGQFWTGVIFFVTVSIYILILRYHNKILNDSKANRGHALGQGKIHLPLGK